MSALPVPSAVDETAPPLRVVVVGHVDHGKSTLIGRLLYDAGGMPDGKFEKLADSAERRGMPFEWAFVTDALRAERDQGITIDVSHIWFQSSVRPYLLLDAPGHREFLRNMVTGAAASDAGLLVIDAVEGLKEQSRRHGFLLTLLGLRQVAVAVSKMDLAGYSEARFNEIAAEVKAFFKEAGVGVAAIVPVAAREGGNLVQHSDAMPWYHGPSVIEALDAFVTLQPSETAPLRLPIQDVYKFDARRIFAGRIETGTLKIGDRLLFSPSNKTAIVASLEAWGPQPAARSARAGESIGMMLDPPIFVERGELASHQVDAPLLSSVIRARVFWLSPKPMVTGARYRLKLGTHETLVEVEAILSVVDSASLASLDIAENKADVQVPGDAVADIVLRARGLVALDSHAKLAPTGRFVLMDGFDVAGGGLVDMTGYPDQRQLMTQKSGNITAVAGHTTAELRRARNGHRGGVLWFTGLSGAGKSTLSVAVEERLFQRGYQVYVLDGDNIRYGLNRNLGFSPADRTENIRRVGEVAALFADAGMLVLTAFISPYRSDREGARRASVNILGDAAKGGFHEIWVKAGLAACETRDPKGLYRKARSGEIAEFTGISAPYEPPFDPELVIDTERQSIDDSVAEVLAYIERHFPLGTR